MIEMGDREVNAERGTKRMKCVQQDDGVHAARDGDNDPVVALDHAVAHDRFVHAIQQHGSIVAARTPRCNGLRGSGFRGYARCMHRVGCAVVTLWLAVSLPATALMRVERMAGQTWVDVVVDASGWEIAVSRGLPARVDVVMVAGSQGTLRCECRVGILDLVPFRLTAGFLAGRFAVEGSLHLGPVRLALQRDIARRSSARWAMAVAVAPRIAVAAQGSVRAADPGLELTLMAFSAASPLTACSMSIAAGRLRLSAGVGW